VPFRDRSDAGQRLAEALAKFRNDRCIVYALPRGGLPVGIEIARVLKAPLDVILVRKLKAPSQPELALGAVVDGDEPELVINEEIASQLDPSGDDIRLAAGKELEEIERRRALYLRDGTQQSAMGRTAIVVDDGIATGATARAAIAALRRRAPKRIVLAVPVAPSDVALEMRREVDELICLELRDDFSSVGSFYADFPQVSDATVVMLLDQARKELADHTA
jgi:putative phosphoribosyl transferase